MLKRHLMTHYQMTPDQYRAKWNLPADYPMVAPNYAEQRRTLAKKIGLGTKRRKTLKPNSPPSRLAEIKRRPGDRAGAAALCLRITLSFRNKRNAPISAAMARKIDLEALCNEKGLRITEQRRVIARVLSRGRGPSRRREGL